jgi:hypothetical protein
LKCGHRPEGSTRFYTTKLVIARTPLPKRQILEHLRLTLVAVGAPLWCLYVIEKIGQVAALRGSLRYGYPPFPKS